MKGMNGCASFSTLSYTYTSTARVWRHTVRGGGGGQAGGVGGSGHAMGRRQGRGQEGSEAQAAARASRTTQTCIHMHTHTRTLPRRRRRPTCAAAAASSPYSRALAASMYQSAKSLHTKSYSRRPASPKSNLRGGDGAVRRGEGAARGP